MTVDSVKEWLPFLESAPEEIRAYLLILFWLLIALLMVTAILKILMNKEFKQLYRFIGYCGSSFAHVTRQFAKGASESIALPEPYPRIRRVFEVTFMINNYLAAFLFGSFFLSFTVLLVMSDGVGFWQRNFGMLVSVLLGYFTIFCFSQAERDRIKLYKQ